MYKSIFDRLACAKGCFRGLCQLGCPLFILGVSDRRLFVRTPIVCTGGLRRSCPDPCASHLSSSIRLNLFILLSSSCCLAGLGSEIVPYMLCSRSACTDFFKHLQQLSVYTIMDTNVVYLSCVVFWVGRRLKTVPRHADLLFAVVVAATT